MRIKDLKVGDICRGENWVVVEPAERVEPTEPLENVRIKPCSEFTDDDHIVYSAVYVTESGKTTALVLLRRVGDYDYGGDYSEFVDGKWRQLGLVPNPTAEFASEYVAAPLAIDPSFESPDQDLRRYHAEKFREWSPCLVA